jgi:hypothetical protein
MGVSLGALGALPPSPLFVSELLILLGGVQAGEVAVVAIAAVRKQHRGERPIVALTAVLGAGLLALTAAAMLLPGSEFIATLAEGAL